MNWTCKRCNFTGNTDNETYCASCHEPRPSVEEEIEEGRDYRRKIIEELKEKIILPERKCPKGHPMYKKEIRGKLRLVCKECGVTYPLETESFWDKIILPERKCPKGHPMYKKEIRGKLRLVCKECGVTYPLETESFWDKIELGQGKMIKCPRCEKKILNKKQYLWHLENIHGISGESIKIKKVPGDYYPVKKLVKAGLMPIIPGIGKRWICISCGGNNPAKFKRCGYCGTPKGRIGRFLEKRRVLEAGNLGIAPKKVGKFRVFTSVLGWGWDTTRGFLTKTTGRATEGLMALTGVKIKTEIFSAIIIAIAGGIVAMFGLIWAGVALIIFAFYTILPSEQQIVDSVRAKHYKKINVERKKATIKAEKLAKAGGSLGDIYNTLVTGGIKEEAAVIMAKNLRDEYLGKKIEKGKLKRKLEQLVKEGAMTEAEKDEKLGEE